MSNNTAVKKVKEEREQSEAMLRAQEKAADGLSNVADRIHDRSDTAKDYLGEKVSNIEEFVGEKTNEIADSSRQKLETASSLGHRAADFLDKSSDSIRNADLEEAKDRMVTKLRERPEIGIAAAGAVGILIGYLLGKRR